MSAQKLNKKERREHKVKRAKQRKIAAICIGILALAVAIFFIVFSIWEARTTVYSDGEQTVWLRPSGRFTAELAGDQKHSGTYEITIDGTWTVITFTYNGETALTHLMENMLFIPDAWQYEPHINTVLMLQ